MNIEQLQRLAESVATLPTAAHAAAHAEPTLRDMARDAIAKRRADADVKRRADADALADYLARCDDYTPAQAAGISRLFALWTRARHVRSVARHTHADDPRLARLNALADRIDEVAERLGSTIPLSRNDMRLNGGNRFYRYAVAHWHEYTAGRHALLVEDPADALQAAYADTLASGNVEPITGRPTFGTMYRAVRAASERMAAARRAEFFATRARLLGYKPTETDYPDVVDSTTEARRLGTYDGMGRPYGDRDTNAAAAGLTQADADRLIVVAHQRNAARRDRIADVGEGFAATVATLLMEGVTVADIVAALGTTPDTLARRIAESSALTGTMPTYTPGEWDATPEPYVGTVGEALLAGLTVSE